MTTANTPDAALETVLFRTGSGDEVVLCGPCLVRVARNERVEAVGTLLLGLLLTTLFGALVVYLCAVGPQATDETGWESLRRSLQGIGQVARSDGYAALAVTSALLIATTLNLSQISARLDNRPPAHASPIVDSRDTRSLIRDEWSLKGEILLAILCVMTTEILGVARFFAGPDAGDTIFMIVAGTLTAWGLLELTRCRAVQRQASAIAQAEDRARERTLRARKERLIAQTTASACARIFVAWWSLWVPGIAVAMLATGAISTLPEVMSSMFTSIVTGGLAIAVSIFAGRGSLYEVGVYRTSHLACASLASACMSGGLAFILVSAYGGEALAGASAICLSVTAVIVTMGTGGIGPARALSRRSLPIPLDQEVQEAADAWQRRTGRSKISVTAPMGFTTLAFAGLAAARNSTASHGSTAPSAGIGALFFAGALVMFSAGVISVTQASDTGTRRGALLLAAIPPATATVTLGAAGNGWYDLGLSGLTACGLVVVTHLLGVAWNGSQRRTPLASLVSHRAAAAFASAQRKSSWSTPASNPRAVESRCGEAGCGSTPPPLRISPTPPNS